MKAIVLLSGGLDSATALYWAKKQKYQCHCLTFDYSQRHKREIKSAKAVAKEARVTLDILPIKLPWSAASSLTNRDMELPSNPIEKIAKSAIPSTYVPARNTLFVAYALSAADALKARSIVLGPNAVDFSGYPDCRPNFYKAFQKVANLGTKSGVSKEPIKILTPLISMSKKDIVRLGEQLNVPWHLTWSCYAGNAKPCRKCDSCKLRRKGFEEAGIEDPIERV